ncbi:MAG: type VII secretion protein EccE [Actinobacteria bacterium 13_2_20CM_2_71_6]|nr:MAG: type VII secretion protein EccE [Actinobacteria bacterium 13_2_20CM_2_71_6]
MTGNRNVHSGQIVVAEIVAVALVVAALSRVPLGWLLGVPVAAALAVLAFGRWRRRWVYQWVGIALRYGSRPRAIPPGADLLALVGPGAEASSVELGGRGYGVIADEFGVTAVLEVGDPTGLLSDAPLALPSPVPLLPPTAPDTPGVQLQLLVSGCPARAAGIPGTSYRQLTEGRVAAYQRVLLAVRVLRDDSGWSDDDLHRALASTLRRLRRRLGVPHRPLGYDALLAALAELAHHDPGSPVRESWPGLYAGGLRQASLRVRRFAGLRPELAGQLIPRLLALPATATTVSLAASQAGADLVVRVAAPSATGLGTAVQALRRLVGSAGLEVTRLDGEQLAGLAATLPLGLVGEPAPPGALAQCRTELPGPGVMLGRNRRGVPVTARLIRREPTRVLVVGGVRAAEMLTLRALALGVHVLVQTGRPDAWEPFLRAVSLPSDAIGLVPPGRPLALPAGTPLAPQLVVVDVGPLVGDPPVGEAAWRTTVVLRDDLAAADLDTLARADLVVLQPLRPDEAALAGPTLGLLGEGQEWLTRIRADMIGLVNRRTVRFALLSATPLEQQLIGAPERLAVP